MRHKPKAIQDEKSINFREERIDQFSSLIFYKVGRAFARTNFFRDWSSIHGTLDERPFTLRILNGEFSHVFVIVPAIEIVIHVIVKDHKSWECAYLKLDAKLIIDVLGAINLGHVDDFMIFLEYLIPNRGNCLRVFRPRCVKHDVPRPI